MVFILTVIYDLTVMQRNELMVASNAKSNAILSSFIPEHLRDRLLNNRETGSKEKGGEKAQDFGNLSSFLHNGANRGIMSSDEPEHSISSPLADLYLDTTLLNADIAGTYGSTI